MLWETYRCSICSEYIKLYRRSAMLIYWSHNSAVLYSERDLLINYILAFSLWTASGKNVISSCLDRVLSCWNTELAIERADWSASRFIILHLCCVSNGESCMHSSDELFQRSREGYFGVYFPSCEATREINTKITLEWTQKQFVTRVHISFYFLHDMTNPQMTIKYDDLYTSSPCPTGSVLVLVMTS